MPRVGQPHKQDLNRIWAQVQAELKAQPDVPQHRNAGLRYGFAALAISLMIVIPFVAGDGKGSGRVVTPPTPVIEAKDAATASPEHVVAVATQVRP